MEKRYVIAKRVFSGDMLLEAFVFNIHMEKGLDSDFRYLSNRFQCSARHRFTWRNPRRIKSFDLFSRLHSALGTFFILDNIAFHKSSIEWNSVLVHV